MNAQSTDGTAPEIQYLKRSGKPTLAYRYSPATDGNFAPLVMFLGGYRSDMNGTKANYFEQQCQSRGQAYIRFDYAGHGQSEGRFEDGTIGSWMEDALSILDHLAQGPVILVGSSMGGWIALLVARARDGLVQGVIGIAAAPDFTEDMFQTRLDEAQQKQLLSEGIVYVDNDYSDEPYAFTKAFYEEAKAHLLLNETQNVSYTLRLVQGMQDKDVPWETAVKIQKTYAMSDADIIFVDEGDHSLSRDEDLVLIDKEIKVLSA